LRNGIYKKKYQTGFTGLVGFFFACGEIPLGRRPFYLSNPVNPVQKIIQKSNPFDTQCPLGKKYYGKYVTVIMNRSTKAHEGMICVLILVPGVFVAERIASKFLF
jgi:hypothetical protein